MVLMTALDFVYRYVPKALLHETPLHTCLAPAEVRLLSVTLGCSSLLSLQLEAPGDKSCPCCRQPLTSTQPAAGGFLVEVRQILRAS